MNTEFTVVPCEEAKEWLKAQPDLETAWNTCKRGDWLWWGLIHHKDWLPAKEVSAEFANWCAKQAKKHAADAYVYFAYAYAASAAYAAAADAADTAAYAAYAASASAAYAAAADAADTAAYAAAYADARDAELLKQAAWIREHVPCPKEAQK